MRQLGVYIQLYTRFTGDKKVVALGQYGEEGALAMLLYVVMALYCKEQGSDGVVPAHALPLLAMQAHIDQSHVEALAKHLLSKELITVLSDGSMVVCAYTKINGTAEDSMRLHQQRAEAGRMGGSKRRISAGHKGSEASAKAGAKQPAKQVSSVSLSHRRGEDSSTSGTDINTRTAEQHVREGNADEDELLQVVVDAIEVTTGWPITPGQALRVRDRLTAGRTIANPNRSLVNAITTMSRDELRAMVGPAPRTDAWSDLGGQAGPGRPAPPPVAHNGQAARHPSARTVAQALARPDGEQRPASDEQRQQHADEARKALANRPGQLQPVPEPDDGGLF